MSPTKRIIILVAVLGGGYVAATSGVRWWVDRRIESVDGRVLDFALLDTQGQLWRASELRGKTVILNFFRSQCEGCLAERDAVRALAERLDPERAVLLGVCMDRVEEYPVEMTTATLTLMDYRHPVLFADTAFVDTFHGAGWAHVTPITYVAGPDGKVTGHRRGHQNIEGLLAALPAGVLRGG